MIMLHRDDISEMVLVTARISGFCDIWETALAPHQDEVQLREQWFQMFPEVMDDVLVIYDAVAFGQTTWVSD
jgi:hypothetical protein